jgi:hypothetical protein
LTLFVGVAAVCALTAPTLAQGEGYVVPGSTETIRVEAPDVREVGKPMTLTVAGTADGLHRLFVYGEADHSEGCAPWPHQEQAQVGAVTLAGTEGESLDAGHFSKSFVVVPANAAWYAACAYLAAAPSANPDAFAYGCFVVPASLTDNINCYMFNEPLYLAVADAELAASAPERHAAESRQREEAEQAARRTSEEAAAKAAAEQAAWNKRIEEATGRAAAPACHVPKLRRHTLAGVRNLLREAHCRLGRVSEPRQEHGERVVSGQHPRPGQTLPPDSPVSVVLRVRVE